MCVCVFSVYFHNKEMTRGRFPAPPSKLMAGGKKNEKEKKKRNDTNLNFRKCIKL